MLKLSKTFSLSHKKYKFLPNSSADKILIIDDFPFFPSGIKAVCSSHLQISEIHVVRMGSKHLTGLKVYRCPARNTFSRIQKQHMSPHQGTNYSCQIPGTDWETKNLSSTKLSFPSSAIIVTTSIPLKIFILAGCELQTHPHTEHLPHIRETLILCWYIVIFTVCELSGHLAASQYLLFQYQRYPLAG